MKTWGGHFGTYCSAACIRVKSEVTAAAGDAYADIQLGSGSAFVKELDGMVRGLYARCQEELDRLQDAMGNTVS